jgi:hypothetical protein
MKAVLYLRLASGLTFLHAALHTVNVLFGKPEPGAQQIAVAAMKANTFLVTGLHRSFWDFYMGSALAGSVLLLAESVVFWQLSALAKSDGPRLRPVLATFMVAYLALAINSFTYFFAPPVVAELIIALCLGLAFFKSR